MGASPKRNPELPTLERPSNAELDLAFATFLDRSEQLKRTRERAKESRELATELMRAHRHELDLDTNGNPTYVYRDGNKVIAIKLVTTSRIVTEIIDDGTDPAAERIG